MAAKGSTSKGSVKAGNKETGKETDLIRRITWDKVAKKKLPQFQVGDTVAISVKVKEGEKERLQLFTGVVVKMQGSGVGRSFTVRKIASGVGVERTFPMLSPVIDKIEVSSRGKVRRSRLFYLRGLKGRSARLDSDAYYSGADAAGAADEVAAPEEAATAPAAAAGTEEKAKAAPAKKAPAAKAKA